MMVSRFGDVVFLPQLCGQREALRWRSLPQPAGSRSISSTWREEPRRFWSHRMRESILIDSGWPGLNDRDPKRIVHALNDLARCDQLDHLVTTHWHMDHFGGVAGLARMVSIGHFWDRGLPEDGDTRVDFPDGNRPNDPLGIAYRAASAGKRKALQAGDLLPLKGVRAQVVASGGRSSTRPRPVLARPCRQASQSTV